jgi:hypothetical protein
MDEAETGIAVATVVDVDAVGIVVEVAAQIVDQGATGIASRANTRTLLCQRITLR